MNKKFEQYKEKCDSDINQLTNQMADLSRVSNFLVFFPYTHTYLF